MKRAIIAATALLSSTIMSTPAFAVTTPAAEGLSAANLVAAQLQCTNLAAAHAPLVYTGTLDESSIVATWVSGPTEIDATARDKTNIIGTGIFTPGTTYLDGNPFRIGGSVNLFGDQYATAGSWSDSTYDFTNDFTTTYSYAFNCTMTETVANPGHHVWTGPLQATEAQQACEAADNNVHETTDQGWCVYVPGEGTTDEGRPDEAGTPIQQAQTDNLAGHEEHGGPVLATGGPFHIGQVVVCISPSTTTKKGVPGAWVAKNGYDGGSFSGAGTPPAPGCNTPYFKVAPWGSGTESSNGTYISVPDYSY